MSADEIEIGKVLDELYAMISGPAGPRDWSRQRAIFHEESRQMRTWIEANGQPAIKIMGRDAYAADTAPFFAENDFYEIETARRSTSSAISHMSGASTKRADRPMPPISTDAGSTRSSSTRTLAAGK